MKRPLSREELIEKQENTDKITRKVAIVGVFAVVFYFFTKLLFL
jgi:hypothetical protein